MNNMDIRTVKLRLDTKTQSTDTRGGKSPLLFVNMWRDVQTNTVTEVVSRNPGNRYNSRGQ